VLWRRVPGAVLLLGEHQNDPIAVTGPGADLWELLDRPLTESAAGTALRTRYRVETAQVTADVTRLLGELEERGLVERAD